MLRGEKSFYILIALTFATILFLLSHSYMVLPGYTVCLLLTFISRTAVIPIAWDGAGVTTG